MFETSNLITNLTKEDFHMGFFDDLGKSLTYQGMIEASKDKNGKPDKWKVAGMAAGMGLNSSQLANLGAMLGAQGGFDDDKEKE